VTTKIDLEALAEMRLGDAAGLFSAGRYSAAYYLAGYAVELGIKACIAGLFQANAIPDKDLVTKIYQHNLNALLGLTSVEQQFHQDRKADRLLDANWGIASKWNEASRYAMWDQFAAASMLQAVGDQGHGVLQWLKKHW